VSEVIKIIHTIEVGDLHAAAQGTGDDSPRHCVWIAIIPSPQATVTKMNHPSS
jgi:hypothetical protein